MVKRLEADFKATLQQQKTLEAWAIWLKTVVSEVLKPFEGKPNFVKAARQFLLKWSFYRLVIFSSSHTVCYKSIVLAASYIIRN